MGNLYDDLTDEEREACDKFAAEHKISKAIAAIIIRSSDDSEKRLDALKTMQAAIKAGAGKDGPKREAEAKVQKLQKQYDDAVDKKDVVQQIALKNRLQAAVNDLKALA
jgi:hypothetical protein